MTIQRRLIGGYEVTRLSHLRRSDDYGTGRRCHYCGGPVNRYQPGDICCRCEDAGLPAPMPQIEMVVEPLVVAMTEDVFRQDMPAAELREAFAQCFGSMKAAAEYLGLCSNNLYNYTGKKCRKRWRTLPQKHVDRLNAYVRGEVK